MDLPPEVDEYYQRLARARGWPPETNRAVLESVAWFRSLDESTLLRSYYDRVDDEGAVERGARWLFEAVNKDGDIVAIKQIDVSRRGDVRRYSWRCLEDADGGLVDQSLSPTESGLQAISREAFYEIWGKP